MIIGYKINKKVNKHINFVFYLRIVFTSSTVTNNLEF